MRVYVDLVTHLPAAQIYERSLIQGATAKRGDGRTIEVQFHRSGTPERLPLGTVITFIAKSEGKYDQDPPLAILELTDDHRPDSDAGFYVGKVSYNTEGLDEALASGDEDNENDLPSVLADAEISWLLPDLGAEPESSDTYPLTIQNDVYKGNEGLPSEGDPTYLTAAQVYAILAAFRTYASVAVSTAGDTTLTKSDARTIIQTLRVAAGAGAGTYTRNVILATTDAAEGDIARIIIDFAASANPTITVRNATAGGTLLETIAGSGTAYQAEAIYTFNGTAWTK